MKNLFIINLLIILNISANSQEMKVTYKTIKDKNDKMNYVTDVTYPQVDFGPEALMGVRGIAQDINSEIESSVNMYVKSFEEELFKLKGDSKEGEINSFKITSESEISGGTLLSVKFTLFTNITGMAHPLTNDSSINYSTLMTGQLELKDLFRADSEYLKFISLYTQKELESYAYSHGNENIFDMIKLGTAPEENNFKAWNIRNDSLSITFNPSQATPDYFGIQEVKIALNSMMDLIDKSGPLEYLFR